MKLLSFHVTVGAAAALLVAAPAVAVPAAIDGAVIAKTRLAANVKLDASRQPAAVLKFLGLKRGDRVLDLLAGAGYYSEIMARAIGKRGRVIAWNPTAFANSDRIKPAWVEIGKHVNNTQMYGTETDAIALAPASFDFAMLHLVYHDSYWESEKFKFRRIDPNALLGKLYRAMKPGGIVGVIDHVGKPGDTRKIVDATHRIDPETVKADFARAGFILDGSSDMFRSAADDYDKSVFDPALRGKTDRVVYRFKKPG